MNRVNFAQCSSVIVDVCRAHGTWFDRDELRRIVEFIRAGGLEKAKARENASLEEERRRLKRAVQTERLGNPYRSNPDYLEFPDCLSAVASLLRGFLD
jgi:Zn-finger nucleic acid-binding protein